VEGGAPVRLAAGTVIDPVWSPDGALIVYAGSNVGGLSPLLAVRPDGTPENLPPIRVFTNGERFRFTPRGDVIYMQNRGVAQDFWHLDVTTKKTRRLTQFTDNATMRTFDVSADGRAIIFDRLREHANIVLIDLKKQPTSGRFHARSVESRPFGFVHRCCSG